MWECAIGTITLPVRIAIHPVDTVRGIGADLGMRAKTFVDIAADPSGAKEAITDALFVVGPNNSIAIIGDAGGQVIFYKVASFIPTVINGIRYGREFKLGKNCRVAPYGNRAGHPTGRFPHYHRSVPDPKRPGDSLPGQGIKRHRPWDTKPNDKSFWDRFE